MQDVSQTCGQVGTNINTVLGHDGIMIGFVDRTLSFKVTAKLNRPHHALMMNWNQICLDRTFGHVEDMIRFWWPCPYFQGHSKVKYFKFESVFSWCEVFFLMCKICTMGRIGTKFAWIQHLGMLKT